MANNSNNSKKYVSLTRLSDFLDNIRLLYSEIGHKHTTADMTDYKVDTTLSPTSTNPVQNKVLDAEFEAISTAMNILEQAIDDKADVNHNHDDRYYTESEINTKLAGKSDTSHKHDSLYDAKGSAADSLSYANAYTDENISALSEGFSEVIYQMYGDDISEDGAPTIRGIANDEANTALESAKDYTDSVASGKANASHIHDDRYYTETEVDTKLNEKSDKTHNHDSAYDAKGAAADSLASAKSYTDTKTANLASTSTVDTKISTHNTSTSAHSDIRDLITGLTTRLNTLANSDDTTLDQMSEVVAYIKNNKSLIDGITTSKVNVSDIVNNLTTNTTNKPLSAAQGVAIKTLIDALQEELDSHTHAIADVSGLQTALDGKAASSHGTHVSYSTTAPVMDGTASAGSASTVARSDHKHPTDTSRAAKTDLDTHTGNTTVHITSAERTNWNAAKTTAESAKTRADNAYTLAESKVDSLSDLGITATATELNYVDGVKSNVQTQLDAKQATVTGAATTITGSNLTASRALVSNSSGKVAVSAVTSTELGYLDGVKSNVQTQIDQLKNVVDSIPQSDWNQNDSTKLDFVKNRPFYTTDPVDTVIAEGTIPANGMMQTTASLNSLTLGETYNAIFDGAAYNNLLCENYDGLPSIGNDLFVFAIQSGRAMAYAANSSASHTLKVIALLPSIVPLDRKYIAEHIDMFAGEKVDGKVYTIDGVQVTAGKGAEVFNDYSTNIASGQYSHAEGMKNTASGMLSHAEGWSTVASGAYSHTEGYETTASESYAHAEGWNTEATNRAAHAEGFATHATGQFSHAEGDNATASGRAAHAEGYVTEATADYSHAEGMNTIASSEYQHVQGKYNIVDEADTYAHIVGNGTSNSSRKNIHTLDWSGNAWFKGDVYVGGSGQDDANASKLITEAYQFITVEDIDAICGATV